MNKVYSRLRSLLVFMALAPASALDVLGQVRAPAEDEKELTVYLQAAHVENASGTADRAAQIDELRLRYGATVDARWYREYTQFALDYDASKTKYSEDTQTEESIVEGESSFLLGTSTSFYEFEAEHSIRRLLTAPELSPTLVSNTRERQILRARPTLRSYLGSANRLSVSYDYMDVRFPDLSVNDSTHQGIDFQYLRDISPTHDVALVLGQRDIDYSDSGQDDYRTQRAALLWFGEQRLFNYRLMAGLSEIEPVIGESYRRSIGGVQVVWQQANNRFELFVNKSVSDTSAGDGNDSFLTGETSFDGATEVRDQVDRIDAGIIWAYAGLCERCAWVTSIGRQRLDYVNLSENDNEQTVFDTNFAYEFSSALTGRVGFLHSQSTYFGEAAARPDTTGQLMRASADYRVNRHFEVTASIEQDRREAVTEGASDYSVRSYGLLLRWVF